MLSEGYSPYVALCEICVYMYIVCDGKYWKIVHLMFCVEVEAVILGQCVCGRCSSRINITVLSSLVLNHR